MGPIAFQGRPPHPPHLVGGHGSGRASGSAVRRGIRAAARWPRPGRRTHRLCGEEGCDPPLLRSLLDCLLRGSNDPHFGALCPHRSPAEALQSPETRGQRQAQDWIRGIRAQSGRRRQEELCEKCTNKSHETRRKNVR